jgi:phosphatidylserine/phosphatidylglycerophosphate/cardiolipin synthase-like enzyme
MVVSDWFLSPDERGNPATQVDRRHSDGSSWSTGNDVRTLVHGATYFAALLRSIRSMGAGDLLMFTDWRGDPDERLDGAGTEVSKVLEDAAARGVIVKGLVWRSHLDRFTLSEQENRHLGEDIEAAGGECQRDMRVRPGGSHHQKFVVLRHPRQPERDIAFIGGIDLCHSRRDDSDHRGDPQTQQMADDYGPRPPWHDLQVAIQGPAVADIEASFRERWDDPAPLTRNPIDLGADLLRHDEHRRGVLPPQLSDPWPRGSQWVQVLRTYPNRRPGYPFAPNGERSIARAYQKAAARAHSLVYIEDQYLWNAEIADCFATALGQNPNLRMIAVIPHYPDQEGRISTPMNLVGRDEALARLREAGGNRFGVYGLENAAGTPIYVHAKVCIIDDLWACVGSANLNRRSWTHDSELSCAVLDEAHDLREPHVLDRYGHGARRFARDLRLELMREHLGREDGDDYDLGDPAAAFTTLAQAADALDQWTRNGRTGPRPRGQLRPYDSPPLSRTVRLWATALNRSIADPDGRPIRERLKHRL